jgi:predicted Fe-Mo cluster-binding NifX family protein
MAFSDRMKEILDQGVLVSKELAAKAGVKAQDWGEKGFQASKELVAKAGAKAQDLGERGVLTLEIKQLENQAQKLIGRLGAEAYHAFAEKGVKTISADTQAIKTLLAEIASVREAIEKRETELRNRKGQGA